MQENNSIIDGELIQVINPLEITLKEAETPILIRPKDRSFTSMCEHIARCAGYCYNRKTVKLGDEAINFVRHLVKLKHGRALEFGTLIFCGSYKDELPDTKVLTRTSSPFVKKFDVYEEDYDFVIVTNLRYYLENFFFDMVDGFDRLSKFWNEEDYDGINNIDPRTKLILADNFLFYKYISERPTVLFPTISRAIADEFRTHTMLSSLMRSTRYTGAGESVPVFVLPHKVASLPLQDIDRQNYIDDYAKACGAAYQVYKSLIISGHEKQFARDVLPLGIATQLVQCGFRPAWFNLIDQRTAAAAHPDAQYLALSLSCVFAANEIKKPKWNW